MAKVTKTTNPLHFEDLEPHRFEDLVRALTYDFRNWQSIEATGRSGSDDGFDARAWEKVEDQNSDEEPEREEEEENFHQPMEGKLWQIQCKREKQLGPQRVSQIIKDTVDSKSPPYGYILSAPVNFSKESYDVFRVELRKCGVLEFYLWGKAELEDMLFLPKNDNLLFAFFGFSLVTRQKSKSSKIRALISNKNKLMKALNVSSYHHKMHESILTRDINDETYPYIDKSKSFEEKPPWREHIVIEFYPLGLIVEARNYYAYIDREKKEFDFTRSIDLVNRQSERNNFDENKRKLENHVRDFWEHLPKKNQAKISVKGIVFFKDMLVVDTKGDTMHEFPHIFVDYQINDGPFRSRWGVLELEGEEIIPERNGYKKVKFFPKDFPKIKKGKIHQDKKLNFDKEDLKVFRASVEEPELYDTDNKLAGVEIRDFIPLEKDPNDQYAHQQYFEITHKYETTVEDYIKDTPYLKERIEKQVGRPIDEKEKIAVYEVKLTYEWATKEE